MKEKERHVIYVSGLNDKSFIKKVFACLLVLIWKFYGYRGHPIALEWETGTEFAPKLDRLVSKIDELYAGGDKVFLIGSSAGGSAVLNAYAQRLYMVKGVANLSGRLRRGENVKPTLEEAAKHSEAFEKSVLLFEKINEPTLSEMDRMKVLTITPSFDRVVPASTVSLKGATNCIAKIPTHSLAGILLPTVFIGMVFEFFE